MLVTRPQQGARATAARIAAMGFVPVLAPLLRIERLAPELPDRGGVQAVLVTSANAFAALPREFSSLPLFAVGDATAARAREAGYVHVESAGGDASDLAALVSARCSRDGMPLLLASGEGQGSVVTETLGRGGFSVLRREVYAARPVGSLPEAARSAFDAERLRSALFFSAETARVFVALTDDAGLSDRVRMLEALAIGDAAAVALERLPWRGIRVATRPTQDDLLALLR